MSSQPPQTVGADSVGLAPWPAEYAQLLLKQYRRIARQRKHLESLLEELELDESAVKRELSRLSGTDHDLDSEHSRDSASRPPNGGELSIWMLGKFRVEIWGTLLIGDGTDRASPVLRYLAAAGPAGVHKEQLATQFWPDSDLKTARRNLHQAIYSIRRFFGECGAEGKLTFNSDRYALGADGDMWRDVDELVRLVDAARVAKRDGDESSAIDAYRRAEVAYGGEFLAEYPYDEWVFASRERYRALHREAAAAVMTQSREAGDHCTVLGLASRLLMFDPCDEDACRHLMRAHEALDQPHLAVMAFTTLVEHLRGVLDVDPLPETRALAAECDRK